MDTLRLFLAIDIPSFAKEKIIEVQNRFKKLGLDAAWVKPSNIHLTLKFLGNTGKLLHIIESMAPQLRPLPSFRVSLAETGAFPNPRNPRILWVGLRDPENKLDPLRKIIEDGMEQIGFPPESKKFTPHLTLARIKSRKGNSRLEQEIRAIGKIDSDSFEVTGVRLYQSQLTPQGALYTMLKEFSFKQNR